jgi:hypothetical protein
MRKATTKVSLATWVNDKDVIAKWFIRMLFKIDIVELWNIVFKLFLFHDLFNEVFTIIPSPWLIYLAKIFYDEASLLNAVTVYANCSFSLGMDTKGCLVNSKLKVFNQ